jgi:hypothetical protein
VQKSTRPRPFAFVLMPFDKSFDDTFELAIEPACDAAGAYAERVDQQIFTGSILDRVYNPRTPPKFPHPWPPQTPPPELIGRGL